MTFLNFTRICSVCLFSIALLICSAANSKTILVVGDSLSAAYRMPKESGWVHLLSDRINEQSPGWQVVNSSISGDTTANGLNRLPNLLKKYQPEIVIIELGGNDGLRGYPLLIIKKNLEKMITLSQKQQAKVLLLGIQLPPNYGKKYTDGIKALYQNLHEEYDTAFIPFMLENIALNPKLMLRDGIHPNAKAQPLILENVYPELAKLLNSL